MGKLTSKAATTALAGACAAAFVAFAATSPAGAAVVAFDSPLAVGATLNTSENLNYKGIDTPLPGYIFHTSHYGADTALWNTVVAGGSAAAPADGQVLKVSLEGCAQPAQDGPPPLTQIHFQVLAPLPDGGAKVELTSGPFDIPVCGQAGASGTTVTSYVPVNLCIAAGDYVAFNDEGGYVENVYRSGVPYQVMGSVPGSTMDSFIRGNGTGNGAVFSPSDSTAADGFATNQNVELMLQATLGSGPDASHICPGGTQGLPEPAASPARRLSKALKLSRQTSAVNRHRVTVVSMYCLQNTGCEGSAVLSSPDGHVRYGRSTFAIPSGKTSRIAIKLDRVAIARLRRHHHRLRALLNVWVGHFEHQVVRLT
jgi:hypothetical protein